MIWTGLSKCLLTAGIKFLGNVNLCVSPWRLTDLHSGHIPVDICLFSSSLGFPVNMGMCFIIALFSSSATLWFPVVSCYPECSGIYSPAWPLPLVQDIQTWYWQDGSWRGWAHRPVFKVLAMPTWDPQCSPPRAGKRKEKKKNKANKKTKQKPYGHGGMHLALCHPSAEEARDQEDSGGAYWLVSLN